MLLLYTRLRGRRQRKISLKDATPDGNAACTKEREYMKRKKRRDNIDDDDDDVNEREMVPSSLICHAHTEILEKRNKKKKKKVA